MHKRMNGSLSVVRSHEEDIPRISTPRSLLACKRVGVKPNELKFRDQQSFPGSVAQRKVRFSAWESDRRKILTSVLKTYADILKRGPSPYEASLDPLLLPYVQGPSKSDPPPPNNDGSDEAFARKQAAEVEHIIMAELKAKQVRERQERIDDSRRKKTAARQRELARKRRAEAAAARKRVKDQEALERQRAREVREAVRRDAELARSQAEEQARERAKQRAAALRHQAEMEERRRQLAEQRDARERQRLATVAERERQLALREQQMREKAERKRKAALAAAAKRAEETAKRQRAVALAAHKQQLERERQASERERHAEELRARHAREERIAAARLKEKRDEQLSRRRAIAHRAAEAERERLIASAARQAAVTGRLEGLERQRKAEARARGERAAFERELRVLRAERRRRAEAYAQEVLERGLEEKARRAAERTAAVDRQRKAKAMTAQKLKMKREGLKETVSKLSSMANLTPESLPPDVLELLGPDSVLLDPRRLERALGGGQNTPHIPRGTGVSAVKLEETATAPQTPARVPHTVHPNAHLLVPHPPHANSRMPGRRAATLPANSRRSLFARLPKIGASQHTLDQPQPTVTQDVGRRTPHPPAVTPQPHIEKKEPRPRLKLFETSSSLPTAPTPPRPSYGPMEERAAEVRRRMAGRRREAQRQSLLAHTVDPRERSMLLRRFQRERAAELR